MYKKNVVKNYCLLYKCHEWWPPSHQEICVRKNIIIILYFKTKGIKAFQSNFSASSKKGLYGRDE